MWIFLPTGFLSIVRKGPTLDTLCIRSRGRRDLEAFLARCEQHGIEKPEIIDGAGTDYRYRVYMDKADVSVIMAGIILDLDYSNFKSAAGRVQGNSRLSPTAMHALHDIWSVVHRGWRGC